MNNIIKLPRRRRKSSESKLTYIVYSMTGEIVFASGTKSLAEAVSEDLEGSYIIWEQQGLGQTTLQRWRDESDRA